MTMKHWKIFSLLLIGLVLVASLYGIHLIRSGFSAADEPSTLEKVAARTARLLSIPSGAANEKNPFPASDENLREARERFADRCASCHGIDGKGRTNIGANLYPKPPDLGAAETQSLKDGEIHYIVKNGVRLSGMPAWGNPHAEEAQESWKLVIFIRSLGPLTAKEETQQAQETGAARYVGSQACEKCHERIYNRWKKTPMANVVRDPHEHPEAIIPDLATNTVSKFKREDVALVYGSLWKQRYFTKVGGDYFPEPAQWDVTHKMWRPYFVAKGTDWWEPFYAADNRKRPTGPTCDGCHSVDYNIHTKQVAEWNVGCERCHGAGSTHAEHPTRSNILNPERMNSVRANDTCIQCHSQGRPPTSPIEGQYYDWPVGYRPGLELKDFWQLEAHTLGETTFTHYADGTAHKNRMQGNDFSQSLMYRRGVTCFSCHDVHGTENYAQLRKPVEKLCLDCHGPASVNGPREATLEAHTHHQSGSAGSQCVECHMPKIETTIADVKVRAHTFAFIAPAMTDKYKIPNPCTSCHADKTTAWATEALRRWPEESPWRLE
jgi:predicted CXXCH cytochrome family protein